MGPYRRIAKLTDGSLGGLDEKRPVTISGAGRSHSSHALRRASQILSTQPALRPTGFTPQISSAYSLMVRSELNLPMRAVFRMDRLVHSASFL